MDYFIPKSLNDAEKLKKKPGRNFYLAGGTILNWRGTPRADALIDLKSLGLEGIRDLAAEVEIGAMTTIQEIAESRVVPSPLATAALLFTSRNIRNMATLGGNVAGKFFISNILPVLICYRAKVKYFSNGKKKATSLVEWLSKRDGIVLSVKIPKTGRVVKFREEKIVASDFTSVFTSVGYSLSDGMLKDAEISLSGVSGWYFVSKNSTEQLNGKKTEDISIEAVNDAVGKEIKPIGDLKMSKEVKRRIVEEHITDILNEIKGSAI